MNAVTQQDEFSKSLKALEVFLTTRTNLAMFASFFDELMHDNTASIIQSLDPKLLEIDSIDDLIVVYECVVITISAAFLSQALTNYFEIKKIKPVLEDVYLENLLDGFENREEFINGLKFFRNSVFHIHSYKARDKKIAEDFFDNCKKFGGTCMAFNELRNALHDYTEKCFNGKLLIFPEKIYTKNHDEVLRYLENLEVDEKNRERIINLLKHEYRYKFSIRDLEGRA